MRAANSRSDPGDRLNRQVNRWRTAVALILAAALGLGALSVVTPFGHRVQTLAARLSGWSRPQAPPSRGAQAALARRAPGQRSSFSGIAAVGPLFTTTAGGRLGRHFCTASVVDSPARDLLITAAHCVTGNGGRHIVFVPGYHNGRAPYGVWQITRVVVDSNWAASADADDDVAFLVAGRPGGARIQDVTGGDRLSIGQPGGQVVTVVGYPDTAGDPIACRNRTRTFSPAQFEFDCPGYTNGTSGSPLLADLNPATGHGTVIGVIGGYEQGGDTADVSYAARFGPGVAALFRCAATRAPLLLPSGFGACSRS